MTTYLIGIDGDYAEAENYVIAHNDMPGDQGSVTFVIGGRYLDKYERRDGRWKISHRIGIEDWSVKVPTPANRGKGLVGDIPIGAVGKDDPTHDFFRLIA